MKEEKSYNCKGKKELFEIGKCVKCKHLSFCLDEKAEKKDALLDLYIANRIEEGWVI